MAPRESQKRAALKWDKENMTTLGCKVKREQAAAFKSYCEGQGKRSNTVLKDYVLACIGEQDSGGAVTGTPIRAAAGPQEAAPTVGSAFTLPPDLLENIRRMAEAEGADVADFVSKASYAYAMRDDEEAVQEAAERPQWAGGIPVPSDVLEAVQQAAEAAGEAVPEFIARAVSETAERDILSRRMG